MKVANATGEEVPGANLKACVTPASGADLNASFTPPTADEFLAAFDTFARAVRRARGTAPQSGNGVLTLSQYGLLQPLADRESAGVRQLAIEAGISAATAPRTTGARSP